MCGNSYFLMFFGDIYVPSNLYAILERIKKFVWINSSCGFNSRNYVAKIKVKSENIKLYGCFPAKSSRTMVLFNAIIKILF